MNRLATVSANGRSLAPVNLDTAALPALVLLSDPHSPSAEAYRSLAANLQFAYADRQLQTIGVTSAAQGEGKSTTVANLAVALAQSGRHVIVVDADLRRPGQHTLFGVDRDEGLANVLKTDDAQLPLQDTVAAGVRILSSGPLPSNPLEALASRRFDQVLALARAQADFVLVDTPPAGALADVAVVAPRLEGMLLVVSAGKTKRDLARRAREQLERVNANLLGVVLTDVRADSKLYRY
ncbi:MAG: CpsD/CapB family tyrosine-protein kinase [Chloroflexi bacterium]|nr:CpsD/CapB family tyrosine-protein kinase [Chloroflexota bacterium]MBV9595428.1 CpsD/CapB family tyrosine-protein kinase [Chloroflexota bacterium]